MFPEWPHLFCTYLRLGRLFNKKICRGNKAERDYNKMHHYGNTRLIVIEYKITKYPFVWKWKDKANCRFKGRQGTKPFPSCHCPCPCLGHVTPQVEEGEIPTSQGIPPCCLRFCCWPRAPLGAGGRCCFSTCPPRLQAGDGEGGQGGLAAGLVAALFMSFLFNPEGQFRSCPGLAQTGDKTEWHQNKQNETILILGRTNSCLVAPSSVLAELCLKRIQDPPVSAIPACSTASRAALLPNCQEFDSSLWWQCWKDRTARCQGQTCAVLPEEDSVLPGWSRSTCSFGLGRGTASPSMGHIRPNTVFLPHEVCAWHEHILGSKWDLWNNFQTALVHQSDTLTLQHDSYHLPSLADKKRIQNGSL